MTSSEQQSPPSSSTTIHHLHNHVSLYRSKSTGTMQHVPRRLSSGSACETCRRRKTKCDGGQPCGFCASNRIECIHRPSKRKRSSPKYSKPILDQRYHLPSTASSSPSWSSLPSSSPPSSTCSVSPPPPPSDHHQHHLMKQISCPSFFNHSGKKEMPSMLDQLSCRTFSAVTLAASENKTTFPIYHLHSDFERPSY
ncbi:uncharacterized protein BX664DRAFT_383690 [Halteromyces radiatus]|uniref:uncharacterized protein n=1 Tax=Halteromyces radiatus TaxID=101107 RepID=UPI00221F9E30|nr:uncharacterized protein BX664DRAFT_383690 [Halteromyces radiatus]KAI8097395.1 hypothetical protein BX664DRAFT_383690 [Halteromyces radiatus]